MGIFSALNPFEKGTSPERLTEHEVRGVLSLLAETDDAVIRVELARGRKMAAEGLQAPAEMAITHTPQPEVAAQETTAQFIDRMAGFETPPRYEPSTTLQTSAAPTAEADMASDARRQITEIFGAASMPHGNLTGAYDDQEAA